jgi:SH3 domain protein
MSNVTVRRWKFAVPLVLALPVVIAAAQVPAVPPKPALAESPAGLLAAQVRYVSDEMAITLRKTKGVDAAVAGLLASGTRLELLETDAATGYARVRVAPGREGWVLARYLAMEPAARERLAKIQVQLEEQQAMVRLLEAENSRLRNQASAAPPAPAALPRAPRVTEGSELAPPTRGESMVTGALIFFAGLLSGVIVQWIPRRERRNWADL